MIKNLLLTLVLIAFSAAVYGQASVIDLRDSTEHDPYHLNDAIIGSSSSIEVILKGGETYEIGSRRLNYGLTVRTDPESDMKAIIEIGNNFWLAEEEGGLVLDSIVFDNVHFLCDGNYIFNVKNDYTLDKVAFNNCRIENARGVWRSQCTDAKVVDFSFDNCVIDTIGEYTLLRPQGGNIIENVSVTNTTIEQTLGIFRFSTSPTSVVLENVTIYEGDDAGHWLNAMFEFESFGSLELTNVLIGPGKGGQVGGLSASTPGTITVTNSYFTSDYDENPDFAIPDLTAYTGSSTDLWADPVNGDFTIIDNNFDAKFSTGDPRWIPARLAVLSVSPGELSPAFDPTVLTYTCELPRDTEAVIVDAIAGHDGATVSGAGVIDVSDGSGTANVVVLEGTISQTYVIEFTVLGVGVEDDLGGEVKLYYNALNDEVVVKDTKGTRGLVHVDVFNITGQSVKQMKFVNSDSQTNISTSDLKSGLYIMRGSFTDNSNVYLKFMK